MHVPGEELTLRGLPPKQSRMFGTARTTESGYETFQRSMSWQSYCKSGRILKKTKSRHTAVSSSGLQSEILRRKTTPRGIPRLSGGPRMGLTVTEPIVIEKREDVRSIYRWPDRWSRRVV